MNERDVVIPIETVKELLRQMEECGFVSTTLHEIRVFTLAQRPTQRAADVLVRCQKCNALIETTVHCDVCGTFEPTRR